MEKAPQRRLHDIITDKLLSKWSLNQLSTRLDELNTQIANGGSMYWANLRESEALIGELQKRGATNHGTTSK
jgi:hypothetical protein